MGTTAVLWATLTVGCADLTGLMSDQPIDLECRGPGAVFGSIDAAAVDALTYAYLQPRTAREARRVRGGTIHRVDNGYSYDEIHVAGRVAPHRLRDILEPQDVAHFRIYPGLGNYEVDRANERPSHTDLGIVERKDPLHRPLYILHPSLMIREYRGEEIERIEVADLRHPEQGLFELDRGREYFAQHCAICHGERDGRGELARWLSPPPASFIDASWASSATPERTYRSVSEGVSGTSMRAWNGDLGERETWDLVAYVMDARPISLSRKPTGFGEATRDVPGARRGSGPGGSDEDLSAW